MNLNIQDMCVCEQHKQNKDFLKEIPRSNVKTLLWCRCLIQSFASCWLIWPNPGSILSLRRSAFVLTITSRLLGLHSLTAVSVAMRAKSCLSTVAFDVALIWLCPFTDSSPPGFKENAPAIQLSRRINKEEHNYSQVRLCPICGD